MILNPISLFSLITLFFRLYKAPVFFLYSHDNDLIGWFIRDVLTNHHIRLIGQETSTPGIFIGPFFYYFLIPFYLLTNLDPIGSTVAVALISIITTLSLYHIFSKIWGKNAGYLAGFFHSTSFFITILEREVVPTQPMFLWTVWFFYSIYQIIKGNQKYFILLGVLISLIWNINMSLILLLPLIPLAFVLSRKKLNIKLTIFGFITLILLSLPLIFFESRHGFSQTKAFISSLVTNQKDVVNGADKLARTFHLMAKNVTNLFVGTDFPIKFWYVFAFFMVSFLYLVSKKAIDRSLSLIMSLWFVFIFGFFSIYSKVLSEYYLNGLNIIWFTIFVLLVNFLLKQKRPSQIFAIILILVFSLLNIYRFKTYPINQSGYTQRKAIVQYIHTDQLKNNYPCISISYITDPGYNLGYRYFFWRENMHVNNPISGSPVYSIVFPLSGVDKVDKSFGAIGLIYPNYKKYKKEEIQKTCEGFNNNETDGMFGFTN